MAAAAPARAISSALKVLVMVPAPRDLAMARAAPRVAMASCVVGECSSACLAVWRNVSSLVCYAVALFGCDN